MNDNSDLSKRLEAMRSDTPKQMLEGLDADISCAVHRVIALYGMMKQPDFERYLGKLTDNIKESAMSSYAKFQGYIANQKMKEKEDAEKLTQHEESETKGS